MYRTGIYFEVERFTGELVKRGNKLLRRYDNGDIEYADDIDESVIIAIENDEFANILSQIEDDTYRVYTVA